MSLSAPLDSLLGELRRAASRSFKDAAPIPAGLNHSPEFLRLEKSRLFGAEWICVGRDDEVDAPGRFLTLQIADTPILLLRDHDGALRAFVNACAHRFACLVPDSQGRAKKFTCRYHAWTYDLEGRLVSAPFMDMKDGFDIADHRLRPLHHCVWEGFVYVSLADSPPPPLQATLQALTDNVVGRYGMGEYRTVIRERMRWRANWKNLVENFTESYHVPMAHKKTFAQHGKPIEDYVCGEDSEHYCYHRAPQQSAEGPGAAHPENDRLQGEWRRTMVDFCIFPNQLVTLMPDYLWYISVQPDGVGHLDAVWGVAVPPEVLDSIPESRFEQWKQEFLGYMAVANEEDRELVEALWVGSGASRLPRGTYHPIERNLWQFTRYLATRIVDAEEI